MASIVLIYIWIGFSIWQGDIDGSAAVRIGSDALFCMVDMVSVFKVGWVQIPDSNLYISMYICN